MDLISPCSPQMQNPGLIYRLNTGIGFRLAGENAQNDGILGEFDIGYQSEPLSDHYSLEAGSSIDLFGETQHVEAYVQFNYHPHRQWVLSLRTTGGGVSDEREQANADDKQDFGAILNGSLQISYRLDKNFWLGLRSGVDAQAYGKSGDDQGTQYSLANYLSLAYHLTD